SDRLMWSWKDSDRFLWRIDGGAPRLLGKVASQPWGGAISPDGKYFAVAPLGADGVVELYDIGDEALTRRGPLPDANSRLLGNASMSFSTTGRLAVPGPDGKVRLWDAAPREPK